MANSYNSKANNKRNKRNKFDYIPRVKPSFMCTKCHNVIVDEKARFNDNPTAIMRKYCPFCKKNTKMVK